MVFNPARPEITSVTSESLQAKIRELLPSQDGFGADLAAQNVIVPVVDLTAAAEGSDVPQFLQTALAFGSQTAFDESNGSAVVASVGGFYRIVGTTTIHTAGGAAKSAAITMTDGATTKIVWSNRTEAIGTSQAFSESFDLIFFLRAGDSASVIADSTCNIIGSVRQVADINGVLVQPSGFSPQ